MDLEERIAEAGFNTHWVNSVQNAAAVLETLDAGRRHTRCRGSDADQHSPGPGAEGPRHSVCRPQRVPAQHRSRRLRRRPLGAKTRRNQHNDQDHETLIAADAHRHRTSPRDFASTDNGSLGRSRVVGGTRCSIADLSFPLLACVASVESPVALRVFSRPSAVCTLSDREAKPLYARETGATHRRPSWRCTLAVRSCDEGSAAMRSETTRRTFFAGRERGCAGRALGPSQAARRGRTSRGLRRPHAASGCPVRLGDPSVRSHRPAAE